MEAITMIPESLRNTLTSQDPLLLTLTLLSALGLAVVMDRIWFWLGMALRYRPVSPEVFDLTRQRRRSPPKDKMGTGHYLEKVVFTCLEMGAGDELLTQTITEQIALMNAHLGLLDLISKIAPLIGILGTVIGMATSFGGVGALAAASPTAISGGISVALKTTAYGLVISIVCTVTSVAFKRLTDRAQLKIGRICCEIRQVNNVHAAMGNGPESEPDHNRGPDPHAGHDLPDHPAVAGHIDAQLHRERIPGKLPGLC
jgi:biopolymer transport protein ExbB